MVGKLQRRTLETRRRILEAASRMIALNGFDDTSVDAIAAAAGVAKATVFAHFADKTSLLIAVRLAHLDALLEDLRRAVDGLIADPARNNARAEVPALLTPWLSLYREDPDFARLFLIQSTLKDGQYTRDFVRACSGMEAEVGRAIHVLVARGALRSNVAAALLTQAVIAFHYHVIVGFSLCQLTDEAQQTALMQDLLGLLL